MTEMHASVIEIDNIGVMFIGESGSGKSMNAYKLIKYHGAYLVGDDYVDLIIDKKEIIAKPKKSIEGLIEIRNIGIIKEDFLEQINIKLVIELVDEEVERLPLYDKFKIEKANCCKIKLNKNDDFIDLKVLAAVDVINNKNKLIEGFLDKK